MPAYVLWCPLCKKTHDMEELQDGDDCPGCKLRGTLEEVRLESYEALRNEPVKIDNATALEVRGRMFEQKLFGITDRNVWQSKDQMMGMIQDCWDWTLWRPKYKPYKHKDAECVCCTSDRLQYHVYQDYIDIEDKLEQQTISSRVIVVCTACGASMAITKDFKSAMSYAPIGGSREGKSNTIFKYRIEGAAFDPWDIAIPMAAYIYDVGMGSFLRMINQEEWITLKGFIKQGTKRNDYLRAYPCPGIEKKEPEPKPERQKKKTRRQRKAAK